LVFGELGDSRNYGKWRFAQLFGDDSDGFRSGLDDDGSDMEICGGVRGGSFLGGLRLEGVNFPYLGFLSTPNPPNIVEYRFLGTK
jgi:hypothetical protein